MRQTHGASFYDALRVAETIPGIGKSVAKLAGICADDPGAAHEAGIF